SDISVLGLSMGGWGALRLAGKFPDRFQAAAGVSPLSHISQVASFAPTDLRQEHCPRIEDPDLAELLTSRGDNLPALRISCGTQDELIGTARLLHDRLAAAGPPH